VTEPTDPIEPASAETASPTPGETAPGAARRQLDRAPSERFGRRRREAAVVEVPTEAGSPLRALAMGSLGALFGTVIYLILAVGFSFSAGLLIVAIFTGRFVGLFVRAGAAGTLSSPARTVLSVVIFLVAMTVSIVATWLSAGVEGGVLPFSDFLDQSYGTPLVSLQFMLGTLMAWWASR
jgi:hypothetical protein